MPSIRAIKGCNVMGSDGRYVGRAVGVLFHPSEPKAVGLAIEPPALAVVVPRPHRYIPLSIVETTGPDSVTLTVAKIPSARAAAKMSGMDWDRTAFWLGMPVRTSGGERLGVVNDAVFSAKTGAVGSLTLSGGAAADATLGRGTLDAAEVEGFDGSAVVVRRAPLRQERGGGAARQAATGVAAVKVVGGKALEQAGEASRNALRRAGSTSAARRAYGVLKDWTRQARNAMSEDDGD